MESDVTFNVCQLGILGQKLNHDERHQLFDILQLQRDLTDDEIFCQLSKMR